MSLEGVLTANTLTLAAGQSGRAASVEVKAGDGVTAGQPLLRYENSGFRETLAKEKQKLLQLGRLLPPEYISLPDPRHPGEDGETLADSLARQEADESEAVKALQRASDLEARASVAYSRISIQHSKGQANRQQLLLAESRLNEAREQLRLARERQEKISMQRASAVTAIRRVLDFQKAGGADKIPLPERLANYEEQRRKVEELGRAGAGMTLDSPSNAVVLEVLVRSGDELAPATPCFTLQPAQIPLMIDCAVEARRTEKLLVGQRCLVSFPAVGDKKYAGYVAKVEPGADPARSRVGVGILRQDGSEAQLPPGAVANVLVLLREPPYTLDVADSPVPSPSGMP